MVVSSGLFLNGQHKTQTLLQHEICLLCICAVIHMYDMSLSLSVNTKMSGCKTLSLCGFGNDENTKGNHRLHIAVTIICI